MYIKGFHDIWKMWGQYNYRYSFCISLSFPEPPTMHMLVLSWYTPDLCPFTSWFFFQFFTLENSFKLFLSSLILSSSGSTCCLASIFLSGMIFQF